MDNTLRRIMLMNFEYGMGIEGYRFDGAMAMASDERILKLYLEVNLEFFFQIVETQVLPHTILCI